ncbi:MAG: ABC transporter permease [Sterolibacterium sp.]
MWNRIRNLLLKDMIQFARDKTLLIIIVYLNTICVLICGYAMIFEIKNMQVAVIDFDRSVVSRSLIDKYNLSDAFKVAGVADTQEQAESWMRSGKVSYVLVIPNNFGQDLRLGREPQLQILLDGTNSNAATMAKDYTKEIVRRFEIEFSKSPDRTSTVKPVMQVWYNRTQTLESFVVISTIAAGFLMIGVIYSAASITREKEIGTIDQLMVTPTRVWEIFLAKTICTVIVGLIGFFPSLVILWWFGVPMHGSLMLFLFLAGIFLISAVAIGVFIASVTRTLQQSLLLCLFGIFPMDFLSGVLTPIDSLPKIIQLTANLSPAKHFIDICVGIFLKGAGIVELWPAALSMAAIGAVLYLLAAWRFKANLSTG